MSMDKALTKKQKQKARSYLESRGWERSGYWWKPPKCDPENPEYLLPHDALMQQFLVDLMPILDALMPESCVWTYDEDVDKWDAACGELNSYMILVGNPTDNGMKFCPFCGTRIEEVWPNPRIYREESAKQEPEIPHVYGAFVDSMA